MYTQERATRRKSPSPRAKRFHNLKTSKQQEESEAKKQNQDAFEEFLQSQNSLYSIKKKPFRRPSPNVSLDSSPVSGTSIGSYKKYNATNRKCTIKPSPLFSSNLSQLTSSSDDDSDNNNTSRNKKRSYSAIKTIKDHDSVNSGGSCYRKRQMNSSFKIKRHNIFTPKQRIKEEDSDSDDLIKTKTYTSQFKRSRVTMDSSSSDDEKSTIQKRSTPSTISYKTPSSSKNAATNKISTINSNISNTSENNPKKRNLLTTLNEVEPTAKKDTKPKTTTTTFGTKNTTSTSKFKSIRRRYDDYNSSDEDREAAEFFAKQKTQEQASVTSNPCKVSSTTDEKPAVRKNSLFYFSDDSSVDNKVEKETLVKKEEVKIRNPISLSKQQNNIRISDNTTIKTAPSVLDDLWNDIDSRSEGSKKEETEKKKTNSKSKSTSNKKQSTKVKNEDENDFYESIANIPMNDDDEYSENDELKLKPEFDNPKFGPFELIPLDLKPEEVDIKPSLQGDETMIDSIVPASINRYIREYQREGVKFLYSKLIQKKGAILGDDMGLGKTVQIITLLAALFGKTGTKKDDVDIKSRYREISSELLEARKKAEHDLLVGGEIVDVTTTSPHRKYGIKSSWSPILLVVPPTVKVNWHNEIEQWGYFAVSLFNEKDKRQEELQKIQNGFNEVMICGRSLLSRCKSDLIKIPWKLIIVDEFHEFKNKRTTNYKSLHEIKLMHECPVIGLTGTPFQNNHEELYNLVSMCQPGLLGDPEQFKYHFEKPLKEARSKDSKNALRELGKQRQIELQELLREVHIRRSKVDVLKDDLTDKEEKVIFCPLSDVQKKIYKHVLNLPEFQLLKMANVGCDCGVNKSIYKEYIKLKTKKEQRTFLKRNKNRIKKRKQCCYQIPLNMNRDEHSYEPVIDPRAVLWRSYHDDDKECVGPNGQTMCPHCVLFPCMQKLYKITSHASLLQVTDRPEMLEKDTESYAMAKRNLDFAKVALTPEILDHLPGHSYYRMDSIMDDHTLLSGKIQVLDQILRDFSRRQDRVLLFSYSTLTLNLIEHFCRAHGYTSLRLDGQTDSNKRQALVEKFQSTPSIFLFLISTTAGGVGLNLTEANKVIMFDVNWNPSHDEQAQDRAYRIGQRKDVEVIRLISRGTIEEIKYMRQIYKVNLRYQALVPDEEQNRLFSAIQGDEDHKGELFGMENLLKFKDGAFMADIVNGAKSSLDDVTDSNKIVAHSKSKVMQLVNEMDEEQISGEDENFEIGLEQFRHKDILYGGSNHNTSISNPMSKANEECDKNNDVDGEAELEDNECELVCENPVSKKRAIKKRGVLMGKTLEELQNNNTTKYLYMPKYLQDNNGSNNICDLFEAKI